MNRPIPTHVPFWRTGPARCVLVIVVAVVLAQMVGCTDRTPTADEFVIAEKYCAERGLSAVGLSRPINGITVGIACEQKDGRSFYEIPRYVFEQKRDALVGAK